MQNYGQVEAIYLPPSLSDHCPLLFELHHDLPGKGRPFKFRNCIVEHKDFQSTICEQYFDDFGSPMLRVWNNLKAVKVGLKALNTKHFVKVAENLQQAQANLCEV